MAKDRLASGQASDAVLFVLVRCFWLLQAVSLLLPLQTFGLPDSRRSKRSFPLQEYCYVVGVMVNGQVPPAVSLSNPIALK